MDASEPILLPAPPTLAEVLDTGLILPGEAPGQIVEAWAAGRLWGFMSDPVLDVLESVRPSAAPQPVPAGADQRPPKVPRDKLLATPLAAGPLHRALTQLAQASAAGGESMAPLQQPLWLGVGEWPTEPRPLLVLSVTLLRKEMGARWQLRADAPLLGWHPASLAGWAAKGVTPPPLPTDLSSAGFSRWWAELLARTDWPEGLPPRPTIRLLPLVPTVSTAPDEAKTLVAGALRPTIVGGPVSPHLVAVAAQALALTDAEHTTLHAWAQAADETVRRWTYHPQQAVGPLVTAYALALAAAGQRLLVVSPQGAADPALDDLGELLHPSFSAQAPDRAVAAAVGRLLSAPTQVSAAWPEPSASAFARARLQAHEAAPVADPVWQGFRRSELQAALAAIPEGPALPGWAPQAPAQPWSPDLAANCLTVVDDWAAAAAALATPEPARHPLAAFGRVEAEATASAEVFAAAVTELAAKLERLLGQSVELAQSCGLPGPTTLSEAAELTRGLRDLDELAAAGPTAAAMLLDPDGPALPLELPDLLRAWQARRPRYLRIFQEHAWSAQGLEALQAALAKGAGSLSRLLDPDYKEAVRFLGSLYRRERGSPEAAAMADDAALLREVQALRERLQAVSPAVAACFEPHWRGPESSPDRLAARLATAQRVRQRLRQRALAAEAVAALLQTEGWPALAAQAAALLRAIEGTEPLLSEFRARWALTSPVADWCPETPFARLLGALEGWHQAQSAWPTWQRWQTALAQLAASPLSAVLQEWQLGQIALGEVPARARLGLFRHLLAELEAAQGGAEAPEVADAQLRQAALVAQVSEAARARLELLQAARQGVPAAVADVHGHASPRALLAAVAEGKASVAGVEIEARAADLLRALCPVVAVAPSELVLLGQRPVAPCHRLLVLGAHRLPGSMAAWVSQAAGAIVLGCPALAAPSSLWATLTVATSARLLPCPAKVAVACPSLLRPVAAGVPWLGLPPLPGAVVGLHAATLPSEAEGRRGQATAVWAAWQALAPTAGGVVLVPDEGARRALVDAAEAAAMAGQTTPWPTRVLRYDTPAEVGSEPVAHSLCWLDAWGHHPARDALLRQTQALLSQTTVAAVVLFPSTAHTGLLGADDPAPESALAALLAPALAEATERRQAAEPLPVAARALARLQGLSTAGSAIRLGRLALWRQADGAVAAWPIAGAVEPVSPTALGPLLRASGPWSVPNVRALLGLAGESEAARYAWPELPPAEPPPMRRWADFTPAYRLSERPEGEPLEPGGPPVRFPVLSVESIVAVVTQEQPVHEKLVRQRLTDWLKAQGGQGTVAQSAFDSFLFVALDRRKIVRLPSEPAFLVLPGFTTHDLVPRRRDPADPSSRPEFIPLLEATDAAFVVVHALGRIHPSDLPPNLARLLGFEAPRKPLLARLEAALAPHLLELFDLHPDAHGWLQVGQPVAPEPPPALPAAAEPPAPSPAAGSAAAAATAAPAVEPATVPLEAADAATVPPVGVGEAAVGDPLGMTAAEPSPPGAPPDAPAVAALPPTEDNSAAMVETQPPPLM